MLQRVFTARKTENDLSALGNLPPNTAGFVLAHKLQERNYGLIPHFESHDLKHVVLNYEMTPLDEIRMQAYLLGNGNYSPITLLIFLFGLVLKLSFLPTFMANYRRGKVNTSIRNLSVGDCAENELSVVRGAYAPAPKAAVQRISVRQVATPQFLGLSTSAAGVLGMLYCLPYLYSSNLVDVIGAGLPFIAGSILTVGGLYAFALGHRSEQAGRCAAG